MREKVARFGNDGRIAIEGSVSLAGRSRRCVVLGRYVGDRGPLRFRIDAKKRLIPGVRQFKETIGTLLHRRSRERDRREQGKED